jgi:arginine metabolism regulation protein II
LNFEVHVRGATQFRKSQGQGRIVGANTQQLNEISAFFSLIEGTSSLRSEPSPWPGVGHYPSSEEPEFYPPKPGSCLEFQFGITPKIASAIQETCWLAEHLSYYTANKEAIPSGLLEACDSLDQLLSSWTLETETETSITSTDPEMLSIFINQANAWYRAALIYNYRRIHQRSPETLADEIARVACHLHAVENVKAQSSADIRNRAAPMTWPAFVASCDAAKLERDTWRQWWERVQCYGIANYRRQWDVVQQIWDARDLAESETSADWMDIIRDSNIQVLLL